MTHANAAIRASIAYLRRFTQNRRGNVAIITGIVLMVLIFGVGMGVDYTLATRRQDQLNGIADAAALAAATPAMMSQSASVAQSKAQSVFLSQLAQVTNISYSPTNITVTATDTVSGTAVNRQITVSYKANSTNAFASILGMPSIAIGGGSTAKSSVAPRINFYMLLDTSPSMEIAATPAGINTMVTNTASQGGCAFACHETHPSLDNLGNPGGEDNYALARNLGVALRIDNVQSATSQLMSTAQTTATTNYTSYQAAIYTMDYSVNQLIGLTNPNGSLAALQAAAANIQAVTVYDNNCLTSTNCNSDEDSYLDSALQILNGDMPNPGNGTSSPTDSPQEVLFIVSDGVNDQLYGGNRAYNPIGTLISPAQCTAIKNRGIRIAFLYLTYYPLWTNSWYVSHIAPLQFPGAVPASPGQPPASLPADQIAVAAQNCASPGLYFGVDTGGDITAAMTALFQKAVSTARLTQ
jgi:Flp pilus assembly protein TadG